MEKRSSTESWLEPLKRWAWVLSGPAVLLALLWMAPDHGTSWRALHNEGKPGTFTTERKECSGRSGCTSYGTFVSSDGTIRRTDVFIDDGGAEIGGTVAAQSLDDRFPKVYQADSHEFYYMIGLDLAGIAWLCWWTWAYLVKPRRRYRAQL